MSALDEPMLSLNRTVTVPGVAPDVTAPDPWATDPAPVGHDAEWDIPSAGDAPPGSPGEKRPKPGGGGRGWRFPLRPGGGDRSNGIDLRNTWQVLAGSVLIPLGVVFILIAWYGAAHTPYVQQQIPYLVSGSFAGLGCMVLGGLLYWAHWLYRLYDQSDQHHEEQMAAMRQALEVIAGRVGSGDGTSGAGGSATASALSSSGAQAPAGSYVATDTGTVYHVPSCAVIAHHRQGLRVLSASGVGDLEPCRICMPPAS